MNNFPASSVKRAIRDFDSAAADVLGSNFQTYKVRIKTFYNLIENNEIIKFIVGPLLEVKVDLNEIYKNGNGFWIRELNLPSDLDGQLAYVLQLFKDVANGSNELESITYRIYKDKRIEANILSWLSDVARPCFRELSYKLEDLIEDEVEGKDSVSETSLKIFNYGSITASNGSSVAIGKDIQQSISYKNVANEIMERVKAERIVSEEKLPDIEETAKEIEEEINKANPSPGKLKQLAGKVYDIGETALLKVISTTVSDPRWGQAVADTLMNIS
ncbi:hypothetical protein MHH37_06585 [Solibacillus sp. FSL K6-1781]|uniref:hypothetical protein n=1 Tax=Solibacillus sp. FSL K6-1781 TaxID=2921474 RepID=UPI00315A7BF7